MTQKMTSREYRKLVGLDPDGDAYQQAFSRLLRDLKAETGKESE